VLKATHKNTQTHTLSLSLFLSLSLCHKPKKKKPAGGVSMFGDNLEKPTASKPKSSGEARGGREAGGHLICLRVCISIHTIHCHTGGGLFGDSDEEDEGGVFTESPEKKSGGVHKCICMYV